MAGFIEIRNLTKIFGKNTVLDNLNLEIPYNKIFGIIGENGSGKTTLLNTLIGFLKPEKGTILFQSLDIFKDMRGVETRFGFATQAGSFYPKLTVEENLYYFGKLYSIPRKELKERVRKLLDLVELTYAKKTLGGSLSTGMKRRLDIACALIHKPVVLILDEPTEDLDPILRKELLNLIRRINEAGTTIIITSHLLEEVEELCDVIAILHKGKLLKIGSPVAIEREYGKNEIVKLQLESRNYQAFVKKIIQAGGKVEDVDYEGEKILIFTPKGEALLNIIMRLSRLGREKIEHVSIERMSLNIIFESIVRGEKGLMS
ncbi:MAG: ABC transporter ATP-binding protein [Candidatus Nanoarchaeia archaeon]|nr:ABC transporter ATP-binding protein [Candidatus Nanoarchaeia archaeon]MDD5587516.1 ABC transporter ATP-binding protein [Candidatus Nanoarchaeia archaeon]